MKIAIVSLNQIWEDKSKNLLLCEEYIKEATSKDVKLIVFPEMTLTGFSINIDLISEDSKSSESILKFQNLAKIHNIAILFGVVIQDGDKALNNSVFVDNQGDILGCYTKIHPFSFVGENKYFNAGNQLSIIKFNDFNIGLTICYDLRFPELYSALAKNCDIIINIANWPEKRVEHWSILLKARAIENQIFVAGINRIGRDGNNHKYKESSNIYNANGEQINYTRYKNMKIYYLDNKIIEEFKNKFNTTNDRKIEFYKGII